MIQAVQWMAGVSFLIWGLSMLLRAEEWSACMRSLLQQGRHGSLMMGSIALVFGSFIVAFHPLWAGIPTLLTIIGWLAILEGSIYLLFPQAMPVALRIYLKCPLMVTRISGIVTIGIALLLLYAAHRPLVVY